MHCTFPEQNGISSFNWTLNDSAFSSDFGTTNEYSLDNSGNLVWAKNPINSYNSWHISLNQDEATWTLQGPVTIKKGNFPIDIDISVYDAICSLD